MHGGMGFFSRDEIFSYASKSSSGQGQNAGRPAGLTAGYSALCMVRARSRVSNLVRRQVISLESLLESEIT